MVARGGFYTDGTNVLFKSCLIEWDLGFDRRAKQMYINRIKEQLPTELNPMVDVTSASYDRIGQSLSPIFVQYGRGSLEEFCTASPEAWTPGIFDFLYFNSLTKEQKDFIMSQNCFIDVFHKPEKGRATQACSCAYYKLLCLKGKESLLNNLEEFLCWYNDVGFYNVGGT